MHYPIMSFRIIHLIKIHLSWLGLDRLPSANAFSGRLQSRLRIKTIFILSKPRDERVIFMYSVKVSAAKIVYQFIPWQTWFTKQRWKRISLKEKKKKKKVSTCLTKYFAYWRVYSLHKAYRQQTPVLFQMKRNHSKAHTPARTIGNVKEVGM